jgi:hypothetical protein
MEELRDALKQRSLAEQSRFRRDQVIVFVTLVVVVLGVYAAFAISARPRRAPASALGAAAEIPEPAVADRLALRVAQSQAERWARGWRADARLVSVSTRWQLTGGEPSAPQGSSWSFGYYSQRTGQFQTLTVDRSGVQPVREVRVRKAPAPIDADWSLDGDDLLLVFLSNGGNDFLREHDRVTLHFRLSGGKSGRSIWYLSAIDAEVRESFVVTVDARSGEVVRAG